MCPAGYQQAGRWRTGPFAADGAAEGSDVHGLGVDAGWMWLCSADPARVRAIAGVNDCGGATTACGGELRGHWHVGAGCSGTAAVDADGLALAGGCLRTHGGGCGGPEVGEPCRCEGGAAPIALDELSGGEARPTVDAS
ncbi:MAG TPA: hypothetical protein P5076_23345, partial [Myxococcota bacterium]|nr:hypothetical protein [Myxococcota bacterium]